MATKARNERVIEDLLKIPGNETCADCGGQGPRWCSWNLGITLCVACASQHRRLGTHISKVKSLTLDTFTREQIESIRGMGNIKSNELIGNDPKRNPPPTSWEDSARESELEKYIRRKYTTPKAKPQPLRRSPSPPPLPVRSTTTARPAPPTGFATTFEDPHYASTPAHTPSRSQTAPLPAEPPKVPVFGTTLEHRPAGHPGGVEPMRRGRPGSAMNSTNGVAPTQQQQQPAAVQPQQQFASSPYGQQTPQPPLQYLNPQQQQAPPSAFQPQYGNGAMQQQQQPPVPQHGAWGDLMTLASGQPQVQAPIQQSFYQPQQQQQQSLFNPPSFQQPSRSATMPAGASQYFGGMAAPPPQQQPMQPQMTASPYQQFGQGTTSYPFQQHPQQPQQQFGQQQQPNYGQQQGGAFGGGMGQQQFSQPQQQQPQQQRPQFNNPTAFFGSMMPGQAGGGGQGWGGR